MNSNLSLLDLLLSFANGVCSQSDLLRQASAIHASSRHNPSHTLSNPIEQGSHWLLSVLLQIYSQPISIGFAQNLVQLQPQVSQWLKLFEAPDQYQSLSQLLAQTYLQVAQNVPNDIHLALHLSESACRFKADFWPAWGLKAQIMAQQGLISEALEMYQQLRQEHPTELDVLIGLGNMYQVSGAFAQARELYQNLLTSHFISQTKLNPSQKNQQAGILNNLGRLYQQTGEFEQAIQVFTQALECNPNMPEIYLNLGRLQIDLRHWDSAQEILFRALSTLKTNALTADICWLYARVLGFTFQIERALEYQKQALRLAPHRHFWHLQNSLGFPETLFLSPEQVQNDWAKQSLISLKHNKNPLIGSQVLQQELAYLPQNYWSLHYLSDLSFDLLIELRQTLAAQFITLEPIPVKQRTGPLRLGILVSDQHEGIFKMQQGGLLFNLHPEQFIPVLIGRQSKLQDCQHPNLERLELALDLLAAAEQIRQADLDLLYYWEVGSDLLNYFLPFLRPAPIQLTSWGTPSPAAIPGIDYMLFHRAMLHPESSAVFPEKTILLDTLPGYFQDPAPQTGHKTDQEIGLPKGKRLLCLQNVLKYSPSFLNALAQILIESPECQLILLCSDSPWIQAKAEAVIREILPCKRITWIPTPMTRKNYLNLIRHAELVLDTFGISGCQSNLDALAMGIPVLTWVGNSAQARFTTAIYQQMDSPELTVLQCPTIEAYIAQVQYLLSQPEALAQLRARIQMQRKKIFNQTQGTEDFAKALWEIAYKSGLRTK